MNYKDIRQEVIDASLKAQRLGLIRGTSGNISLKSTDGKVIAITPSAIPYEDLRPEMIPLVDEMGNVLEGTCKPSSELPMHTAVLRARPEQRAVVHTHSKCSTILSVIEEPLPVMTIPMVQYSPHTVPIIPFFLPGSLELAEAVTEAIGKTNMAVLLGQHGLLTVGPTLQDAMSCAEYVEEAAEIALYCKLITGKLKALPGESVKALLAILESGRAV